MTRFVVMSISNDGGEAVIVDSLQAAADYIRKERGEGTPPFDDESSAYQNEQLTYMLASTFGYYGPHEIWGNPAWKERYYVAVLVPTLPET